MVKKIQQSLSKASCHQILLEANLEVLALVKPGLIHQSKFFPVTAFLSHCFNVFECTGCVSGEPFFFFLIKIFILFISDTGKGMYGIQQWDRYKKVHT